MRRLIRDPLVHFLVVGIVAFLILSPSGEEVAPQTIVLSETEVAAALGTALARDAQLTKEEAEALIAPLIRDEVLYREALALGLDENDDEVRRRLIEKMAYLSEDLADPQPASEAQLQSFYESAPERFAVPALVTFEQLYFDPRQRGDTLQRDIGLALEALAAGRDAADLGDRTPLRERYESATREQVEILFGSDIADALFTRMPGGWFGPLESDFGMHLLQLGSRSMAYQPAFEDIVGTVRDAWAEQRRQERNEATFGQMRERYDVVIEWPANPGDVFE